MGIGTLRRYHWKDAIQAIADELKSHTAAVESLKNTNDLNKDSLAKIADDIEKTLKAIGKTLEKKND
jgi:ElaB/YqjD/DUF883 family membrane-anchored ribosome-binding protein